MSFVVECVRSLAEFSSLANSLIINKVQMYKPDSQKSWDTVQIVNKKGMQ